MSTFQTDHARAISADARNALLPVMLADGATPDEGKVLHAAARRVERALSELVLLVAEREHAQGQGSTDKPAPVQTLQGSSTQDKDAWKSSPAAEPATCETCETCANNRPRGLSCSNRGIECDENNSAWKPAKTCDGCADRDPPRNPSTCDACVDFNRWHSDANSHPALAPAPAERRYRCTCGATGETYHARAVCGRCLRVCDAEVTP